MKINQKAIALLLAVCIVIGLLTRFLVIRLPQKAEAADTQPGASYLASRAKLNVSAQESTVLAAQSQYHSTAASQPSYHKIKNFRAALKGVVICGDSLVKAINEYGILGTDQVIAKVGAGILYLNEKQEEIVAKKPEYLILHFGENDTEDEQHANSFIYVYKREIRALQKRLPNTKIYVDSIFPVLPSAYEKEPYLKNIEYYNSRLKAMAQELNVPFLDCTPLWKTGKHYYGVDGIHPQSSFYKEQYLPMIVQETGGQDEQ